MARRSTDNAIGAAMPQGAVVRKGATILRCPVCQTTVELLDFCGMDLTCCGPTMHIMPEQLARRGDEPHALSIERRREGLLVSIDPRHPMRRDHHIQWLEVSCGRQRSRQFLSPGQEARAMFRLVEPGPVVARAWCTVDGLWKTTLAAGCPSTLAAAALEALGQDQPPAS